MTENKALPVREFDYLEFWVGNARQAAAYYRRVFGFDQVGYKGPETGTRESASYLLRQGSIHFVLTTPLGPDGAMARHVALHGDGVRDIALRVDDARSAFERAVQRGAQPVEEPVEVTEGGASLVRASVAAFGDTVHSFVERRGEFRAWLPGFIEAEAGEEEGAGLLTVDHVVGNVEEGRMDPWVDFYRDVFGFRHFLTFDDKMIHTSYSALRSKVMANENGKVKLPINEPAPGRGRSQIQEYLDYYGGPGVQHIALLTGDILQSVRELRLRGAEFLSVPDTYYDRLQERVGPIEEDMAEVREERILVDRDDRGYLLQIFTRPVEDRPTLFLEVIQRRGSQGFGVGNFRALFEAIEREQARRGNL
jgi:4-hydroxyphenylpyruvate dioxygenase